MFTVFGNRLHDVRWKFLEFSGLDLCYCSVINVHFFELLKSVIFMIPDFKCSFCSLCSLAVELLNNIILHCVCQQLFWFIFLSLLWMTYCLTSDLNILSLWFGFVNNFFWLFLTFFHFVFLTSFSFHYCILFSYNPFLIILYNQNTIYILPTKF